MGGDPLSRCVFDYAFLCQRGERVRSGLSATILGVKFSLDDFVEITRNLISFFSLSLKRKLPIINMYSLSTDNTSKTKLEIHPFQYKILNKDFDTKLTHNKTLFVFPHIKITFHLIESLHHLRWSPSL